MRAVLLSPAAAPLAEQPPPSPSRTLPVALMAGGGGTFLVFPALLFAGVAPIKANATASLALLPGALASAWVYRDAVRGISRNFILTMSAASLAGSVFGSMLLMYTSNATFSHLVPWLLLMARRAARSPSASRR